jgi:hypothetical protein
MLQYSSYIHLILISDTGIFNYKIINLSKKKKKNLKLIPIPACYEPHRKQTERG